MNIESVVVGNEVRQGTLPVLIDDNQSSNTALANMNAVVVGESRTNGLSTDSSMNDPSVSPMDVDNVSGDVQSIFTPTTVEQRLNAYVEHGPLQERSARERMLHKLGYCGPRLEGNTIRLNGGLGCEGAEAITALPEGLHVPGILNLNGTAMARLPNSLKVEGALWVNDQSALTIHNDDLNKLSAIDLFQCSHIPSWLFTIQPLAADSLNQVSLRPSSDLNPALVQKLNDHWTQNGLSDHCVLELPQANTARPRSMDTLDSAVEFWFDWRNCGMDLPPGLSESVVHAIAPDDRPMVHRWLQQLAQSAESANWRVRHHVLGRSLHSVFNSLVRDGEPAQQRLLAVLDRYPNDGVAALKAFEVQSRLSRADSQADRVAVLRGQLSMQFIHSAVARLKADSVGTTQSCEGVDMAELTMYALSALRVSHNLPIVDYQPEPRARPAALSQQWLNQLGDQLLNYHASLDKGLQISADGSSSRLPGGVAMLANYVD